MFSKLKMDDIKAKDSLGGQEHHFLVLNQISHDAKTFLKMRKHKLEG